MKKSFDNGQLRGAYSAGFDAGLKAGAEQMRREGWKPWKQGDRFPREGEIVKTLVPTISGWIGLGRVKTAWPYDSGLQVWKLSELTGNADEDIFKTADLLYEQIAIKHSEEV